MNESRSLHVLLKCQNNYDLSLSCEIRKCQEIIYNLLKMLNP